MRVKMLESAALKMRVCAVMCPARCRVKNGEPRVTLPSTVIEKFSSVSLAPWQPGGKSDDYLLDALILSWSPPGTARRPPACCAPKASGGSAPPKPSDHRCIALCGPRFIVTDYDQTRTPILI